jgi:hypothetical protein
MNKYVVVAIESILCMNSMQAQLFSLNNKTKNNIMITVWQVNNGKAVEELVEREVISGGKNYSFDVGAITGKPCSLMVQISPAIVSSRLINRYYLSGESDNNDFFVSYAIGHKGKAELFVSSAVKENNVTRIISLGKGDSQPIESGYDMEAMTVK